ncbi:MAG: hypothetical protein NZL93_02415, partial [Chthoniobacterales bacterium]|nr:hypothetical protein [Chthoniobacterales bacterium]
VSGRSAEVVTFSDERRITKYLVEREMGRDEIMLDEVSGFAFVTLLGSSRMFVMPHEKEFKFYVKNPHLDIKGMLMRNPERGRTIGLDKVGQEWRWMNFEQRELFRPTFVTESWVLYERRLLWKGLR